jgi:hypothetical protein
LAEDFLLVEWFLVEELHQWAEDFPLPAAVEAVVKEALAAAKEEVVAALVLDSQLLDSAVLMQQTQDSA